MNSRFRIILSMRVVTTEGYHEIRDAISHDWIRYLQKRDWDIILLPNQLCNIPCFLTAMDPNGLILTGGNDVGPIFKTDNISKTASAERDETEKQALQWFRNKKRPVLGVCRGMQVINVFYGGTLMSDLTNLMQGDGDHNGQVHTIDLIDPRFIKWTGQKALVTNSFHNQGVIQNTLAPGLEAAAMCGPVIEAVIHRNDRVVGIQWHPEREQSVSHFDARLFESFENNYSDLGYP